MKPFIYPDGFLKKLVQTLGDKVYSEEELIPIFQQIDEEFSLSYPRIRMHITCVWDGLLRHFPEHVVVTQEGVGKKGKKSYLVSDPTKVINLLENEHRVASKPRAEKATTKCKPKASKKKEKKGESPVTIEIEGRKATRVTLPKLILSDGAGELTENDHEALWLTAGLINLSHKGLSAHQVADIIRRNRMEISEEDLKILIKREPNLETIGSIIRLKKDASGSTSDAWRAIDKAHNPEQFKRKLLLRTCKSEKTVKDLLGPSAIVKLVSDQTTAGNLYRIKLPGSEETLLRVSIAEGLYEISVPRDEEALLRVAQIYGTLVPENGDYLYCEDEQYYIRVKDAWKTIIRAKLQSTLEWQIRKGEISDTLRG